MDWRRRPLRKRSADRDILDRVLLVEVVESGARFAGLPKSTGAEARLSFGKDGREPGIHLLLIGEIDHHVWIPPGPALELARRSLGPLKGKPVFLHRNRRQILPGESAALYPLLMEMEEVDG